MIYPLRLKEIRELAYEPGTLALLDTKEQEGNPINYSFSLRRILDKNIYAELCDEVERLTNSNNALESDLINTRLNLEHLDNLTSDISAIKHCFERIRDVAYGGGLDKARPISVDALKSYVNLGIKFCDEAML